MRLKKPMFSSRVAWASGWAAGSTSTTTPAARSRATPWPLTSGLGSVCATTTRATPAAISASQHGGVRPWWLHGSSVTSAVAPSVEAPAACAARRAITSACGPPACWVKPSNTRPSASSRRQATRGLGSLRPTACAASSFRPIRAASMADSMAGVGAAKAAASRDKGMSSGLWAGDVLRKALGAEAM